MESSASNTYKQKWQWVLLLGFAVILNATSFFAPSTLTEYPFSEQYEFIKHGDIIDYLYIYSLLLIPVIVIAITTNYLRLANILTSFYIACQLDHNRSIGKLVSFNLEGFIYIWFFIGGLVYIILYQDFRRRFLTHWVRIVSIILAGLFISANLFLALHPALQFGPFSLFNMFCLTLMLFCSSDRLPVKIYGLLLILLGGIAFYILTVNLNCNIAFFDDMGITNNNPIHILKSCSTYYIWLAIGFILHISIRKKNNLHTTPELSKCSTCFQPIAMHAAIFAYIRQRAVQNICSIENR